jgi:hypothetical protein
MLPDHRSEDGREAAARSAGLIHGKESFNHVDAGAAEVVDRSPRASRRPPQRSSVMPGGITSGSEQRPTAKNGHERWLREREVSKVAGQEPGA